MAFLVEKIVTSTPNHSLWETQQQAFEFAAMKLTGWLRDKRCDEETANTVTVLIEQHRYAEAMAAWNQTIKRPSIAVCEVEILARHCHHDRRTTLAYEDVFYAVEPAFDGIEGFVDLFDSSFAALEQAAATLKHWTGKNPLYAHECNELTRQRVRRLLHRNVVAKAIDTWMAAKPTATIAIHKIRITRRDCHHDGA